EPIALLLGEGEDASIIEKFAAPPKQTTPEPAPPVESVPPAPSATAAPAREADNERIFASPLARRMAQQAGLHLGAIGGPGPQGRIVKSDIEAVLSPGRVAATPVRVAPVAVPQPAPTLSALSKERVVALAGNPPYSERPLNAMRRVIAKRLTESKQTVP